MPHIYCVAFEKRAQRTIKYTSAHFLVRASYQNGLATFRYEIR